MNKKNMKSWVDALRSGDYVQGTGRLCTVLPTGEKQYCCLGVAAELAGCEVVSVEPLVLINNPDEAEIKVVHYEDVINDKDGKNSVLLPEKAQEWLGVTTGCPFVHTGEAGDFVVSLTSMNDDRKCSFGEIADAIEKEWLSQ